jgi:hypothetical protein
MQRPPKPGSKQHSRSDVPEFCRHTRVYRILFYVVQQCVLAAQVAGSQQAQPTVAFVVHEGLYLLVCNLQGVMREGGRCVQGVDCMVRPRLFILLPYLG